MRACVVWEDTKSRGKADVLFAVDQGCDDVNRSTFDPRGIAVPTKHPQLSPSYSCAQAPQWWRTTKLHSNIVTTLRACFNVLTTWLLASDDSSAQPEHTALLAVIQPNRGGESVGAVTMLLPTAPVTLVHKMGAMTTTLTQVLGHGDLSNCASLEAIGA